MANDAIGIILILVTVVIVTIVIAVVVVANLAVVASTITVDLRVAGVILDLYY